jgi:hypothetical protein
LLAIERLTARSLNASAVTATRLISVTGYKFFACSKDDIFHTG